MNCTNTDAGDRAEDTCNTGARQYQPMVITDSISRGTDNIPNINTALIATLNFVELPCKRPTIVTGRIRTAKSRTLLVVVVLIVYFRWSIQYSWNPSGFQAAWMGLHSKTAANNEAVPPATTTDINIYEAMAKLLVAPRIRK